MLFNSPSFLFCFLPLALAGYHLLRGEHSTLARTWLVLCSFVFYAWWSPVYLLLLLASIGANYAIGRVVEPEGPAGRFRGGVLAGGIALNLALLAWFKYANFFVESLNATLDTSFHLHAILLPLAISFFTFQQIAYLVDAHRGETREHSFLDYCLFVTFFPQLIAGPIVHHEEMLPQFARRIEPGEAIPHLSVGITIFTIGLFKKVVIADAVAVYATPVFDAALSGAAPGLADAWIGALAYTFQLYFDFSGYSDMAIGLGRMFGIRLPQNFDSPYKAANMIEFWRRWHMTLSRFLRDYLYIGLGGNRRGPVRRYANLMITMLLGGLWHGAAWTFVFWGGLHGLYLVVNHGWRRLSITPSSRAARGGARALTFLCAVVAWVFFRAESFDAAWTMLASMAGIGAGATSLASGAEAWLWIVGLLVAVNVLPNTQEFMADHRPAIDFDPGLRPQGPRWRPTPGYALAGVVITIACVLHLSRVSEFLYYQF